ncbi:MAG: Grx4 family monothiol glutaredoxin [Myxococcota bacterium]|nr:Grx4 family monothiol glutaredoxin [Myxococcota bacterium]
MELDDATRSRIRSLIESDRVVLFMKGHREAPQCGFSATVVRILDQMLPDYSTVDVLSEPAIREGIKAYSSWPTIPQLYVDGEFVGGCDIVQEMHAEGSLPGTLGVEAPTTAEPAVELTDAAAEALRTLAERAGGQPLHLRVDARNRAGMWFGPEEGGQLCVEANGVRLRMDPLTASRADGLRIDAEATPEGPAFRITPAGAAAVKEMSVQELRRRLEEGAPMELLDVRTPEERATAHIEGSRLLDPDLARRLETLDRDTPLVFHCHHGGRSRAAAEHFAALGFREVYNVTGGIDAWSQEIDPSVPRY